MPLELFDYQLAGAAFLAPRKRAGLFDRPRVGKTGQVIRGMDLHGHKRGIILCPAVARENWKREFRRFELVPRKVCKGVTVHDFAAWARGHFDTLVTSYEMGVRWAPHLLQMGEPLQFIHLDEAHYLKNPDTARSKALLGEWSDGMGALISWAEYSWWVTGTPVPNDPMDIYTFLRHVHSISPERELFRKTYFHSRPRTYGSTQHAKPEMLPTLHELIGNNSIARTLAETAKDLPPIFTTTYVVDGDTSEVREALLSHPGLDEAIRRALEEGTGLGKGFADKQPYIATLRRLLGEAKAVPYAATILGELESGLDKVVIFGHHRSVLHNVYNYLTKHGVRCGLLTGDTSEREKNEIQDAFAADRSFRAVLCNIRAAGTAINLTAAAAIDMLESDWAPMANFQALMRVYGPTQTRGVRARFVTLANSFDETVNEIIADKTRAVAALDLNPDANVEALLQ